MKVPADSYFAGLVDGEGCIGIHCRGAGRNKRLSLRVNMAHRQTILAIYNRFKVGSICRRLPLNPNHKTQWVWKCVCNDALNVLVILRPHLITKANIVDKLIAEWSRMKHTKGPDRNA